MLRQFFIHTPRLSAGAWTGRAFGELSKQYNVTLATQVIFFTKLSSRLCSDLSFFLRPLWTVYSGFSSPSALGAAPPPSPSSYRGGRRRWRGISYDGGRGATRTLLPEWETRLEKTVFRFDAVFVSTIRLVSTSSILRGGLLKTARKTPPPTPSVCWRATPKSGSGNPLPSKGKITRVAVTDAASF